MTKLELIKTIETVENIFGIYRNFMTLSKMGKKFAFARTVIVFILYQTAYSEIFIIFTSAGAEVTNDKATVVFVHLYTIVTVINYLVSIFIAIIQSKKFNNLVANIKKVHEYCREGVIYEERIKNLKKWIRIFISIFVICYIINFLISSFRWTINYKDQSLNITLSGILQLILLNWKDTSFQIEFLILHAFVRIINISLAHLHSNLLTLVKSINSWKDGVDESTSIIFQSDLKKWTSAYNHLALCSDGLKTCFGIQIVFCIFILVLFFIGLTYKWIAILVSKSPEAVAVAIALQTIYVLAMILLLHSGQLAKNEGDRLHKLIAKLYNTLLTIPDSNTSELRRYVKALQRQIAVRPIQIPIISAINLEMSLLLAILSTVVSYTIVMLQFSHVV